MLTPQEVSEHAFAKATFGGYNMAMVDEFLDLLTADYETLYKDNATLKAKMKILADKVEEYRSTEDAMRKTLLTVQKMADKMEADAKLEKEKMLQDAAAELAARKAELDQQLRDEQARLAAAKASTAAYVNKLKELYQHEVEYLGSLSQLTAVEPAPDPVAQAADDITAAVDHLVEEEIPDPAPAPEEAPAQQDACLFDQLQELQRKPAADPEEDEDPTAPTRRIDLEHLQFGSDYKFD